MPDNAPRKASTTAILVAAVRASHLRWFPIVSGYPVTPLIGIKVGLPAQPERRNVEVWKIGNY